METAEAGRLPRVRSALMGPSRWADVVEIIGPFLPGVLREGGEILSPMGAPNAVLFLARRPGRAAIDVVTGDPRHAPQTMPLEITVEA
jgi:hypothetical protein